MASIMTLVRLRTLASKRIRPMQPLVHPRLRQISIFSFIRNITATNAVHNNDANAAARPKPLIPDELVDQQQQQQQSTEDAVSENQTDGLPVAETEPASDEKPSPSGMTKQESPDGTDAKETEELMVSSKDAAPVQEEAGIDKLDMISPDPPTEPATPEKPDLNEVEISAQEELTKKPESSATNDKSNPDGIDASSDLSSKSPVATTTSPPTAPTPEPFEKSQTNPSPSSQVESDSVISALNAIESTEPPIQTSAEAPKENTQDEPIEETNLPESPREQQQEELKKISQVQPVEVPSSTSQTPQETPEKDTQKKPADASPNAITKITEAAHAIASPVKLPTFDIMQKIHMPEENKLQITFPIIQSLMKRPEPKKISSEIQLKAWGSLPRDVEYFNEAQIPIIATPSSPSDTAAVTSEGKSAQGSSESSEVPADDSQETASQSPDKAPGKKTLFEKFIGKVSEIATGKHPDNNTSNNKPNESNPTTQEKAGEKKETGDAKKEAQSAENPAEKESSSGKAPETNSPESQANSSKAKRRALRRERAKIAEERAAAAKARQAELAEQARQKAVQAYKLKANTEQKQSASSDAATSKAAQENEAPAKEEDKAKPANKPEQEKDKSDNQTANDKAKALKEKFAAEQVKAEKARLERAQVAKARAEQAKADRAAAEKAKAEKAAADKAKAQAQKAAQEKALAEKAAAAEKVKADKVAAEKARSQKEAAERRNEANFLEQDYDEDYDDESVSKRAKYYAVKNGNNPGIYYQWSDCQAQIEGYDSPVYKAFDSLVEADEFMRAPGPKRWGPPPSKQKFYGVQQGRVPGVYSTWSEARDQVMDHPEPRYRKFDSFEEAEEFVKINDEYVPQSEECDEPEEMALAASGMNGPPVEYQFQTSQRNNTVEIVTPSFTLRVFPNGNAAPADVQRTQSSTVDRPSTKAAANKLAEKIPELLYTLPEARVVAASKKKEIPVYTDGACSGNGRVSGRAGIGVYFGPGDLRNIAEPLPGVRQTSARAELAAIARALEVVRRDFNIAIFSDSKYAVNCLTAWYVGWQRNNWMTSDGRPVENKDIIQSILTKIEERERLSASTRLEWVRGHNRNKWNEQADKLANDGVRKAFAMQ